MSDETRGAERAPWWRCVYEIGKQCDGMAAEIARLRAQQTEPVAVEAQALRLRVPPMSESLRKRIIGCLEDFFDTDDEPSWGLCADRILALLESEGEPVVWRWKWRGRGWRYRKTEPLREYEKTHPGFVKQPLYARAATPSEGRERYYVLGVGGVDIRDTLDEAVARAQEEADSFPLIMEDCGRTEIKVIAGRVLARATPTAQEERK